MKLNMIVIRSCTAVQVFLLTTVMFLSTLVEIICLLIELDAEFNFENAKSKRMILQIPHLMGKLEHRYKDRVIYLQTCS